MSDMVKTPKHYASVLGSALGIEVIDVANALELNGNRFSILKYLCRAGLKDPNKEIEDLEKIVQYATFEIRRLKGEAISDTRRKEAGARIAGANPGDCYYVFSFLDTKIWGPFDSFDVARQYITDHSLTHKSHTVLSGQIPIESFLHPMHSPKRSK